MTHAPEMLAYRLLDEIARFQNFRPLAIEEVTTFIRDNTRVFNIENTWHQLGVFLGTKLIGDVGMHFLGPDNAQVEIGYTISPQYQRNGYGKEAVTHITDHLLNVMKKHRIIASLDPHNAASIALLESVGFRREGCFKKSVLCHGIWQDDLVYALLAEEWMALCSQQPHIQP
jgi:RimJ/RimL family protein N-acetyltransferase